MYNALETSMQELDIPHAQGGYITLDNFPLFI